MNGIELSKSYFFEAGLPLIKGKYPELSERIAAGLVAGGLDSGCGSEIGGFDDEISRDHNWGPRFFLFMSKEDKDVYGSEVNEFLNSELPAEFRGFKTTATTLSNDRVYVTTPEENLEAALKLRGVPEDDIDWITIPEVLLFEYTAGPIFYEPKPLILLLRQQFEYYPDEVWYKRLSYFYFVKMRS